MPDQPAPAESAGQHSPSAGGPPGERGERLAEELRGWLKSLFFALVLVLLFRTHIAEGYQIKGGSMENTLSGSDRLFVEKITHLFRPYEAGDIIVFPHPHEGKKLIKRVAAVGGQTVEIDEGRLYVDGELVEEDYVDPQNFDATHMRERPVPEGELFVLGDNRKRSNDSRNERSVGFIEEDKVVGRAFFRFWPVGELKIFP